MQRRSFADMPCSVAATVDVIGEWWTPLIVRDAMLGVTRFEQFQTRLGIARNVLTVRLERLVAEGILERRVYDEGRDRADYLLTDKGRDLWLAITALRQWGDRWVHGPGHEPLVIDHVGCGATAITVVPTCGDCGEPLDQTQVRARPGPGAAVTP